MTISEQMTEQPEEFRAGGGSPPNTIPPQLAEELAQIIARALVANYRADLLKSSARLDRATKLHECLGVDDPL